MARQQVKPQISRNAARVSLPLSFQKRERKISETPSTDLSFILNCEERERRWIRQEMEKDGESREGRGDMLRVSVGMVLVQVFQTGMALLSKLALDQGMFIFPFLVYRNAIGAACVACFAFVFQR